MPRIFRPGWEADEGAYVEKWSILDASTSCEGLGLARYRWNKPRSIDVADYGCIISVFKGCGFIHLVDSNGQKGQLFLSTFVHAYVPPCNVRFQGVEAGTEIVCLSAPTTALAQGTELIIRNEELMKIEMASLPTSRWSKMATYTSRRLFLHHDKTLLSRNGHPVSWQRTSSSGSGTLSKMSYNHHTEVNLVYEVQGDVRVRTAMHPYARDIWSEWHLLDGNCCYYLDETKPMAEQGVDAFGRRTEQRNKHELDFEHGNFSLFCMFDPGLGGTEAHVDTAGFSSYECFSEVRDSHKYQQFIDDVMKADAIADVKSLRRAQEEARRYIHKSTLV